MLTRLERAASIFATRPGTTPDRRLVLYQSGCWKFVDMQQEHFAVLWDLLLEHCIASRCVVTARMLLSASSTSRQLILDRIDNLTPPSLGDVEVLSPVHDNRAEKLAWAFARCHHCLKPAIDRRKLACMKTGCGVVVLSCALGPRSCGRRSYGDDGPGRLRGGRRVLPPRSTGQVLAPDAHGTPFDRAVQMSAALLRFYKAVTVLELKPTPRVLHNGVLYTIVTLKHEERVFTHTCEAFWELLEIPRNTTTRVILEALVDGDAKWRVFVERALAWYEAGATNTEAC